MSDVRRRVLVSMMVHHDEEISTGAIAESVASLAGDVIHNGYCEHKDKPVSAVIDEVTAVQVRDPEPVE